MTTELGTAFAPASERLVFPTQLVLLENALHENDTEHAHRLLRRGKQLHSALEESECLLLVHELDEDAAGDERVGDENRRIAGDVACDHLLQEAGHRRRVVDSAQRAEDGRELAAAVEEEVIGAVALLGRPLQQLENGCHQRQDELRDNGDERRRSAGTGA